MGIVLTANCGQIEQAVSDLTGAVTFMEGVLGAVKTEQELVRVINTPGTKVLDGDHLECAGMGFQFCMPVPGHEYMPAAKYIDAIGPCVTNLNFYVDDDVHAAALLMASGAEKALQFEMALMAWDKLLGPGNCKPTADLGDGTQAKVAHIKLRGLELQYCQPLTQQGPLHDYLQQYRQGVSAVVFSAKDPDAVLTAADTRELANVEGQYVDWSEEFGGLVRAWNPPRTYRLGSRKITGFDIELERI